MWSPWGLFRRSADNYSQEIRDHQAWTSGFDICLANNSQTQTRVCPELVAAGSALLVQQSETLQFLVIALWIILPFVSIINSHCATV